MAAQAQDAGATEEVPKLRGPVLEEVELEKEVTEASVPDEEIVVETDEDDALMKDAAPPSSDPTVGGWTVPRPMVSLNGYFRLRGELQDKFFLGRRDAPFNYFIPADRGDDQYDGAQPAGGCRGSVVDGSGTSDDACKSGSDRLRFASMRLRLQPTISLSDDVRLHLMIDALDNVVLGSTPESKVFDASGAAVRVPGSPLDSTSATNSPPQSGLNSSRDSIHVRRAWAEVTNRGLGQLRFGRMGHHWGLGMLWNSGEGIDADFSSEIDRVMGITKYKGFFFAASWDFPNQGVTFEPGDALPGIPFDLSRKDDVKQWSLMAAYRLEPDVQAAKLARGDWVLNGGFYFVFRKQFLSSELAGLAPDTASYENIFVRRNAKVFIPNAWVQFMWKGLRIETEIAYIAGKTRLIGFDDSTTTDKFKFRQFGYALEIEYRTLEDKLGLYFNTGYASGDPDVDGLSARENTVAQRTTNARSISHFSFHPNYRVDLILFRNILGRIGGAHYINPGVSYDIIRNAFGQLFGARADVIYSRASREQQAYGSEPNLGVELNTALYYRSEDGPSLMDGYFIQFQYGILFPLAGLKYRKIDGEVDPAVADFKIGKAQTMRILMGINF